MERKRTRGLSGLAKVGPNQAVWGRQPGHVAVMWPDSPQEVSTDRTSILQAALNPTTAFRSDKKMMSIELKREIIEKHEQGVRVVDLSRQYGRSTSMICSVLKRKESIKSVTPAKGLTIISKLRNSLH
ncbi:hypothetical protein LAZ67_18000486 [Cordylochernes scorpioides]|uniref:HTH psq-type domain-containing protein n=1 Tax=Cordylochernes scorpioides TaxID=51811 RepID=A0ABY6LJR5_9ARAC|nr:hypothetical protein LAZ67_18000486 [Cordylochernes scorpioides]